MTLWFVWWPKGIRNHDSQQYTWKKTSFRWSALCLLMASRLAPLSMVVTNFNQDWLMYKLSNIESALAGLQTDTWCNMDYMGPNDSTIGSSYNPGHEHRVPVLRTTGHQRSGLSWKSCRSWSELWEIQTLIYKEMCKKFLVLTKSCRSRTDGPALVSNTAGHPVQCCNYCN